jgi:hypothetical protein
LKIVDPTFQLGNRWKVFSVCACMLVQSRSNNSC